MAYSNISKVHKKCKKKKYFDQIYLTKINNSTFHTIDHTGLRIVSYKLKYKLYVSLKISKTQRKLCKSQRNHSAMHHAYVLQLAKADVCQFHILTVHVHIPKLKGSWFVTRHNM